jgi:formylglycine-generating enzyme required for sulfatase activity
MKFVPVPGTQVLFSIWDTRVADFGAFVESTGYDATRGMWSLDKDGWKTRGKTWNDPGFTQVATRPVVGISWEDAKAFCEWLARREHRFGSLPKGMFYRLPTDEEWSLSAGLGPEAGNTPQEKDSVIRIYPWGKDWPPPPGAGNYCGIESTIGKEPMAWPVIEGYNDGHSRTSPVGSFAPKKNGLYDIGGNVWQYCEDWYNSERKCRVVRGGSWNNNDPENLLASFRGCCVPDDRSSSVGMRCVVAWEA